MRSFKEEFELHEVEGFVKDTVRTYITGELEHPRVAWLRERLAGADATLVSLTLDTRGERLQVDEIRLDSGIRQGPQSLNLVRHLPAVLARLNPQRAAVCVDISGLRHAAIFLVFKLLALEQAPEQLFASYVMPEGYQRARADGAFELSHEFLGIRGLPGFVRREASTPPAALVAFLGFEGTRLARVLDELGSMPQRIIPVIGFPAFAAGWNILALEQNMPVIESNRLHGEIISCNAASVYEAYRVIHEAHQTAGEGPLLVAPLGTRPHALATALYAMENPSTRVLYDHPVEKAFRSIGVRGCLIYHLSRFCRRA